MDFKQFEYVIAVSEAQSISRAAKKLYISQPSLSQYINRIESELGIILFDRSKTPLTLTQEGKIYLETGKNILYLTDQMKQKFKDIAGLNFGRLSIGFTASKANYPIPLILPIFKKHYPNIELSLIEATAIELESLILQGDVDVCLMNLPFRNSRIDYEYIERESIFLATPPDYQVATNCNAHSLDPHINGIIDIKDIENENFILLHNDQRIRQICNVLFEQANIKPKILLETRNIETSLRLTASGMGLSFVPENYAFIFGQTLKYFVISTPPLSWDLVAAYKEGCLSKSAEAFIEITKSYCIANI